MSGTSITAGTATGASRRLPRQRQMAHSTKGHKGQKNHTAVRA